MGGWGGVGGGEDGRTGDADLLLTAKAASLVYDVLFQELFRRWMLMMPGVGEGWDGMVVDLRSSGRIGRFVGLHENSVCGVGAGGGRGVYGK